MSFECVTMLSGAAILLFLIYSDKGMTMVENFKQLNTMSERKNGRRVSCPRSPEYKHSPMIHFDKPTFPIFNNDNNNQFIKSWLIQNVKNC